MKKYLYLVHKTLISKATKSSGIPVDDVFKKKILEFVETEKVKQELE